MYDRLCNMVTINTTRVANWNGARTTDFNGSCDLSPDEYIFENRPLESPQQRNRHLLTCYSASSSSTSEKTLKRNTLAAHNHRPDIRLSASHPRVEELGIWVHDWAVSLLSSEQFCALWRISPSVLPALWAGLGLVVLDLAPSQLQLDFGTDDTECL